MNFSAVSDIRGSIYVSEVPNSFEIKRVFWLNAPAGSVRGEHGHFKNEMYIVLQTGEVRIENRHQDGSVTNNTLSHAGECLFMPKLVWHRLQFKKDSLVLCLNSYAYDPEDYYVDAHS